MWSRKPSRYELALLVSIVLLLIWSGISPHDRFTWWLEVAPILIGVPVLIWIYPKLRLTPLSYTLIWLHCLILMLGGHYTYAQVPLGFWMEDAFGFTRNHYDRIGHFAQGFIPAMLAREIFIRRSPIGRNRWLPFVVICFCLAFSAFYADRVLDRAFGRRRGDGFPGDPGRRVGYAVGHADGADRGDRLADRAVAGAGPAVGEGGGRSYPRSSVSRPSPLAPR